VSEASKSVAPPSARASRYEELRHIVEIVALVAAGAWAFYVFIYQQWLKPLSEPPVLQSMAHLDEQALPHGNALLTITIDVKNIGVPALKMDGTIANIYGIRFAPIPGERVVRVQTTGISFVARTQPIVERRLLVSLLFRNAPFGGSSRIELDPGSDVLYYPHVVVPRGRYDAVSVDYENCFERADDGATANFVQRIKPDGAYDTAALAQEQDARRGIVCEGYSDREFAL
jgi:hypothetical protein